KSELSSLCLGSPAGCCPTPWQSGWFRQCRMLRASLPMHEPDRIPDDEVEISKILRVACLVEAQRAAYRYATRERNSFIGTFHVLEVMSHDVNELEFRRLSTPELAQVRRPTASRFRHTVNRVINRDRG